MLQKAAHTPVISCAAGFCQADYSDSTKPQAMFMNVRCASAVTYAGLSHTPWILTHVVLYL